ncbi:hypothetical protein H5410_051124 [Solanum commersonii]|uniref:Uncharacterized protein n=1 Tax=Solanum commersonii TaxID=4109 RepID=A0A9J5WXC1_SOLCO|nr:hypothetical protein H5410_051124 [Solanum commersonii]
MLTQSLGHLSSGFGFATSLSSKMKTNTTEEEKRRPISNLGKMNSFLQVSTKPSPNLREKYYRLIIIFTLKLFLKRLQFYLVFIVFTNCVAEDHLATLVEITVELGDPPFNQFISFRILIFWIIGRYSTASRN